MVTGELYFRLRYIGTDSIKHFYKYSANGRADPLTLSVDNTYCLFRPGYKGLSNGKTFIINNFGFRDKDRVLKKKKHTIRIIMLGASKSMGFGVNQDEVFTAVLEKMLNMKSKSKCYEVLNFSAGDLHINDFLYLLGNFVMRFDPDIILIDTDNYLWQERELRPLYKGLTRIPPVKITEEGIIPLERNTKPFPKNKYDLIQFYVSDLMKSPYRTLFFLSAMHNNFLVKIERRINSSLNPQQTAVVLRKEKKENENKLRKYCEKIHNLSKNKKVYLLAIARFSGKLNPALKALCPEYGFDYIETDKEGINFNDKNLSIYPGDNHPNKVLHKIYAQAIFKKLINKDSLVDPVCIKSCLFIFR